MSNIETSSSSSPILDHIRLETSRSGGLDSFCQFLVEGFGTGSKYVESRLLEFTSQTLYAWLSSQLLQKLYPILDTPEMNRGLVDPRIEPFGKAIGSLCGVDITDGSVRQKAFKLLMAKEIYDMGMDLSNVLSRCVFQLGDNYFFVPSSVFQQHHKKPTLQTNVVIRYLNNALFNTDISQYYRELLSFIRNEQLNQFWLLRRDIRLATRHYASLAIEFVTQAILNWKGDITLNGLEQLIITGFFAAMEIGFDGFLEANPDVLIRARNLIEADQIKEISYYHIMSPSLDNWLTHDNKYINQLTRFKSVYLNSSSTNLLERLESHAKGRMLSNPLLNKYEYLLVLELIFELNIILGKTAKLKEEFNGGFHKTLQGHMQRLGLESADRFSTQEGLLDSPIFTGCTGSNVSKIFELIYTKWESGLDMHQTLIPRIAES